jgi:HPt (histidine-containing phosphotransfer) domain-containing protein
MQNATINVDAALENLGGDTSLLIELAQMMLSDLDDYRTNLQLALDNEDLVATYEQAHSLKGAVSNFVAEPLRVAALELELAGKKNDLPAAQQALPKVLSAMIDFSVALQTLAQEGIA